MRTHLWLALALLLASPAALLAADDDKVAKQKTAAEENWTRVDAGTAVVHETRLFLIYGSVPLNQLRALAPQLEAAHQVASKAMKFEAKDKLWPGKMTVYVFANRRQYTSFVRVVEKRRPAEDDQASFSVRGELPHLAAGPAMVHDGPSPTAAAVEQLGAAILTRKAGTVPDWVSSGFGRATGWRAAASGTPAAAARAKQRGQVARLLVAKRYTAKDVWSGTLREEEAALLQGSLVEYLAYGPGSSKFLSFLAGFKPDEGKENPTTEDALKAADISPKVLEASWHRWAQQPR